jgi:DNA polymerase-3 subunit alpha
MSAGFVHLHVHTHYSLLDGATRIDKLVETAKAMGMPAVAITDHGNMFGAIEFYNACVKEGVKPIIGCETYLAPTDRRDKESRGLDGKDTAYHQLLLAQDLTGYQNLIKLASIGYREGFYYKPRIDKETLREFSDGLICTSTCLGGIIPQAILNRDQSFAEELAKTYLDIFSPDRFFIELQDHGIDLQRTINPVLTDMAKRLGVGTIVTNDVHYLEHDDVEAHDVLCCISTGKLVSDTERFKFEGDQFYFKSPEEMAKLFPDQPEAMANTLAIADMCNVEFDFSKRHAPVFRPPEGETPEDMLRRIVYAGAERKYGEMTDELRERIDYELEVIQSKGFSSYFLIIWDVMQFCRANSIPCGARGSGCSSVVGYCLDISAPDPLRYGLYFERFMDPDRNEMPDIDVDMCQVGRSRVIDYVREKYGHVAQIITFGTLKAKAAVKDVARVMGLPFNEANQLTKLIPAELKMTIDKALEQEPQLRKLYNEDENITKVIDIAKRLEGLARHAGIHAAGFVLADQPLDTFLPLYQPPGEDGIVTQYDGPTVEQIGLLKMDFLGLRTLSILERARQLVEKGPGNEIDLEHLDLTDQKVYALFARGETKGIFQFESGGMRDVIMKMKPNRIEDLIAANALYRPGPMVNIDAYVSRKHGEGWTTPHPIMTRELEETYGILVYQEQVSRVVNRLGGIDLKRAFRLAKAISKKKTAMIEAEREPFLAGCEANGVDRETADKIFEDILRFGGYAFNKSHSTGYALVAFQTAYMKVYHPVEFMAAVLTFEMSSSDKVTEYMDECRRKGITVLPPDINISDFDFTVDYEHVGDSGLPAIRFGLGAIKGLGSKAVDAIRAARAEDGPYESIYDFCERIDLSAVNRGAVEALICCGSFDRTGAMRKALTLVMPRAIEAGQLAQRDKKDGQMSLFGGAPETVESKKRDIPTDEWSDSEMLAKEKAVLGFFITKHPLASHQQLLDAVATANVADLGRYDDGAEVTLAGMITGMRLVPTKRGRMGIVGFEDFSGSVEGILFSKELEQFQALVVPDAVMILIGQVDKRREAPSVRLNRIVPADDACRLLTESVTVSLIGPVDPEQVLNDSIQLARAHRPSSPKSPVASLVFHVPAGEDHVAIVAAGPDLRVSLENGFIEDALARLGPDRVKFITRQGRTIPPPAFNGAKTESPAAMALVS